MAKKMCGPVKEVQSTADQDGVNEEWTWIIKAV